MPSTKVLTYSLIFFLAILSKILITLASYCDVGIFSTATNLLCVPGSCLINENEYCILIRTDCSVLIISSSVQIIVKAINENHSSPQM